VLHNPNAASGRGAVAKFHIKRDTTEAFVEALMALHGKPQEMLHALSLKTPR
jgi:hypothetical protein